MDNTKKYNEEYDIESDEVRLKKNYTLFTIKKENINICISITYRNGLKLSRKIPY